MTVAVQPMYDDVVVGFRVKAPRRLMLSDLKVGRCSQTANVAHFWADVLEGVRLRSDRTHGSLVVSAVLTDLDGTRLAGNVSGEAVFATEPAERMAGREMVMGLGFWDDNSGSQEPIAPGETRKLVARTQVAGVVKGIAFSQVSLQAAHSSLVGKRLDSSFVDGDDSSVLYYSAFASDLRGISTLVDLDAGDAVELTVTNTTEAPISARDFVALIER